MKVDSVKQAVALKVERLGIKYRQRLGFMRSSEYWATKDISFNVMHGEVLGLIGRNGAGKSSLLKVLAGIMNPDTGAVENYGNSVALLGLTVGLNQRLSGRDNAIMNAMLMGMPRQRVMELLSDIKDTSELGAFFDQPVKVYSAGMNARLRFAIAMQANPDVLLIDEVLGVGDIEFRRKSKEIILQRIRTGNTVVLVSHSLSVIQDLCARVVWIEKGLVKMVGPAGEVLSCYNAAAAGQPLRHK